MSTFDERLRERINNLISETMDDAAAEVRKAVTPPAKTDEERARELQLARIAQEKLYLPGAQVGSDVYLRFDEAAFEQWFKRWFDRQVRAHGGMKAMLGRLR